jgi:hypothetical protein
MNMVKGGITKIISDPAGNLVSSRWAIVKLLPEIW